VLVVDHERRLREEPGLVLAKPIAADVAAGQVVVAIEPDEDDGASTLGLRDFRVVLREPEHRGDSRGVVAGAVEPAVFVRRDVDRLVGRSREGGPHERGLQVGNHLDGE
jgi:hypothetical protein